MFIQFAFSIFSTLIQRRHRVCTEGSLSEKKHNFQRLNTSASAGGKYLCNQNSSKCTEAFTPLTVTISLAGNFRYAKIIGKDMNEPSA